MAHGGWAGHPHAPLIGSPQQHYTDGLAAWEGAECPEFVARTLCSLPETHNLGRGVSYGVAWWLHPPAAGLRAAPSCWS